MLFSALPFTLFAIGALSNLPASWAYPFGAGCCSGGVPAVGPPHLPGGGVSAVFKNGTLSQGSISVLLDGKLLTHGVPASFAVGKAHTLTLKRSAGFKGVLFRLGNVGTGALSPLDATPLGGALSASLVQVASVCTQVSVSGVTHTSNLVKSQAEATLRHNAAATNLPLDITVVISNDGISEFYYSRFILNAVAAKPTVPTKKPVAPPVKPTVRAGKPVASPIRKPVARARSF
jgi:hypothetical protein